MGITKLDSGTWRLQIRRKRLRVDQVYPTEREARREESRYLATTSSKTGTPTLQQAWDLYADSLMFQDKRERTRGTEASRIRKVIKKLDPIRVSDLKSDHVEDYIKWRRKMKPEPSRDAVRLEVAALSALLNFCREKQWISSNPCIGVSRPGGQIVPRRMSAEDEGPLISLLQHDNYRFRFAARLCLLVRETGARPGEWRNATTGDYDRTRDTITFQNTKYHGQPRTVPLTASALVLLAEQMNDVTVKNLGEFGGTDLLFPAVGKKGVVRPMHYTGALRDAKKHHVLPKRIRAHNGRHEFISTLIESSELDDARIMALVGHHSPASMEVYKHVRNIRFRPQMEDVEPLRRKQRMQAIADSLGLVPSMVIEQLTVEREEQTKTGLKDPGDELLYSDTFIRRLKALAALLGTTREERLMNSAKEMAVPDEESDCIKLFET
jgi:integrase